MKTKRMISYTVVTLIALMVAVFLYLLYFENQDTQLQLLGTFALLTVILIWGTIEYSRRSKPIIIEVEESNIKKFVLMSGDGENEQEWYAGGAKSFLVGKSTAVTEVDIELGQTHASSYISNEHAILNYSQGDWYIEDLESRNGVGIKRKMDEHVFRIQPLTAYKINEGDIIYISKVKILVR